MGIFRKRQNAPQPADEGSMYGTVVIQSIEHGWWTVTITSLDRKRFVTVVSNNLMGLRDGMETQLYWEEQTARDGSRVLVMTAAGARIR